MPVSEMLPLRLCFASRPRRLRSRRTLEEYASGVKESGYGI